jgi:TRAP-type uncharacterized transport system fused permease subunit
LVDVDFYIGLPLLNEQVYAILLGIAMGWMMAVVGLVFAVCFPFLVENPDLSLLITIPFFALLTHQTFKHCGSAFGVIVTASLLYGVYKLDPSQLLSFIIVDNTAMLGMPIAIMSTVVFGFILLGQIITQTNLADKVINIVLKHIKSPARVAICSSAIFGSISGSAVSNVMSTGQITIPMMIRLGYSKTRAAAYEAVASTGGQLMPPVMGAAAFLMAEMLMIPYMDVVQVAIAPALAFYIILLITAPNGTHNVPAIVSSLKWPSISKLLIKVGEVTGPMVVLAASVGTVIGILDQTGLSFTLTYKIQALAGGHLFITLGITAVICIILGMGMPTSSAYLLVAIMCAPVLIDVGITPIYAHLFVLYFAVLSMVTPPVALSSMTAAKIAGSDPIKTSFYSMYLAIPLIIAPFIFVFF